MPGIDVAALIKEYQDIKTHLEVQSKIFADYCKPYNAQLELIASQIQGVMTEQGVKSVKSDTGTAILSTIITPKITDREKYLDWVLDNYAQYGAMLQISAPQKDALQEYMDANENRLPPAVDISSFVRFSIRKA